MSGPVSVVILDGGTGMALKEMGHESLDDDPCWSAAIVKTQPQDIIKLHKQFYTSGADLVVTATYQASVDGYKKRFSLDDKEALDLIQLGVTLAKKARDESQVETGRHLYVAASIGPYGATQCDYSEYHGRYADSMSKQELADWHYVRMKAIVETCPDLLAIETIPVVKEAEAILQTLSHFPHMKAWLTFQCKDGLTTGYGDSIVDAVKLAASNKNIVATGVNCVHPKHIPSLLRQIASADIHIPVIVKPNGGLFEHDGSSPERWLLSNHVEEWVGLGARWVGGCCHIYARDLVDVRQVLGQRLDVKLLEGDKLPL